jgi:catechol 2,3-dioxygenase-like lactoylglutathione lyase family enzyme
VAEAADVRWQAGGGKMQILSAIAQLRTTDLAESIRFYTTKVGLTLEFQYQDFYAKLSDEKDPTIEIVDEPLSPRFAITE